MKMLAFILVSLVINYVVFECGRYCGMLQHSKLFDKEIENLKNSLEEIQKTDNLLKKLRKQREDECTGCHSGGEFLERKDTILQAIQRKNKQKAMRISECESCHTEEEEGDRPITQVD